MIERYVLNNCGGLETIALLIAKRFARGKGLSNHVGSDNALLYHFDSEVVFAAYVSHDFKRLTIKRIK
jgi:hypothetical protein